jgi:hypothetical protein
MIPFDCRMRALCLLFLTGGFLGAGAWAHPENEAPAPEGYLTAEIAPAKTSIYIGTVKLSVSPMIRHGNAYAATYTARVFPYFFYNETGQFSIQVSDADLFRLASGQAIDFRGDALRSDGVDRLVRAHAKPSSLSDGQVKVRVVVSPHLTLIFNTTYHLSGWQK